MPASPQRGRLLRAALLVLAPAACCALSLMHGRFPAGPADAVRILLHQVVPDLVPQSWSPAMETVLVNVRLPRILGAALIGGGLAISGASFQTMFRNPLVSPFILGVASGAGFGAALGILVSAGTLGVQAFAFASGALAVFLSYAMARVHKTAPGLALILSGVIVGAFFSSLLSLLKYVADPYDKLPVIVYWLMGSLASMTNARLSSICLPMLLGVGALLSVRWRMNALSLGDDEARALGVDTGRLRLLAVGAATVITASAVSVSGIIGWVGLVIPHLARMIVGPDARKLLPASLSLGACYLLLIDDAARSIMSTEIPLGILTGVIGAPVFALLLRKGRLGWA